MTLIVLEGHSLLQAFSSAIFCICGTLRGPFASAELVCEQKCNQGQSNKYSTNPRQIEAVEIERDASVDTYVCVDTRLGRSPAAPVDTARQQSPHHTVPPRCLLHTPPATTVFTHSQQ